MHPEHHGEHIHLTGYAREQVVLREFNETDRLLTRDGWESLQKLLKSCVPLDVIDQSLNWDTGSLEARFTA